MNKLRTAIILGLFSLTMFSACSPLATTKSSGVQTGQVVKVELFGYVWGQQQGPARKAVVVPSDDNREIIDELVRMFVDVPVGRLDSGTDTKVVGCDALAVRYHMDNGTTVDVTRIFIGYHDVVVIWPDGTATHTEWGAPSLVDYYSQFGTVSDVDIADIPEAQLPT